MKRMLVGGLVGAILVMLIAGFAIPAFAHGPEDDNTAPAGQDSREVMYEACIDGDWEEMAEAMEVIHEQYFTSMPCFSEGFDSLREGTQAPDTTWRYTDGHMGGGMMGGYDGMMGW